MLKNMAGIQFCYRKLLVAGNSRIIFRNGVLLQPNRGRHNLVFQISLQKKSLNFKSRFNLNQPYIYRLASTNVSSDANVLKSSQSPTTATNNPSIETSEPVKPNSEVVIDEASLPPVPTTEIDTSGFEFVTTGLGEASIKSLGLGSWYPSGMIQQCLEFLHVTFDIPWWAAIAALTVILRVLTFPVSLSAKKDSINMMNHMPTITQFQTKMMEARKNGDYFTAATIAQELQQFIGEKKINMLAFTKPMLFQTPFFISMFWGLRGMADAPVESFKTQGLLWFTDLTMCDPYYLLPAILGASMYTIILVGAEGVSLQSVNSPLMQIFLKGMPIVVFAVTTQFSACIVWYWTISNTTVLIQTALLKIPAVAKLCRLPKAIKHDPSVYKPSKKGFIEGFKEGIHNAKITKELEERERLNTLTFERAGSSTIRRTFKHNPKLSHSSKPVVNKV